MRKSCLVYQVEIHSSNGRCVLLASFSNFNDALSFYKREKKSFPKVDKPLIYDDVEDVELRLYYFDGSSDCLASDILFVSNYRYV